MFCFFLRPELSSSDWWYYKLVRIPADKSALSSEQSKWFIKTSRAVGVDWSKIFKNLASKEVLQKISPCRSAYLFCLWGGKPAIWNSNFAPPLWLRSTWNSDGIFLCFLFSFADTISITIRPIYREQFRLSGAPHSVIYKLFCLMTFICSRTVAGAVANIFNMLRRMCGGLNNNKK